MTFAFATLTFLVAAWLAIVVIAGTLEEYGAKVRAALAGRPYATPMLVQTVSSRVSPRHPTRRAIRMQPRPSLRAAA